MSVQCKEWRQWLKAHHTKEGKSFCRRVSGEEALVSAMTLPSREMWEERYGSEDFVFGTEPNDFLRENVGALQNGEVLCLAEGEGRNAVFLLEAYTADQIGRGTGGPQVPELTMSEKGLREELAPLEVVFVQECVRAVIEGPGHTGDGAVVQFIACKKN